MCYTLWIYVRGKRADGSAWLRLTAVNVKNVRVCGIRAFAALVEMGASHHMFGLKPAFRFGFNF